MPDVAALQRLIAEVADDLAQATVIADRVAGYAEELSSSGCPPETAGFVAVLLHRWYTACEAAFERIERTLVGAVPQSEAWHQELLRLMALDLAGVRPIVLRRETSARLLPYLRFRHFVRHAYAVDFDPEKLHALVLPLSDVQRLVSEDAERFLADLRQAVTRALGGDA